MVFTGGLHGWFGQTAPVPVGPYRGDQVEDEEVVRVKEETDTIRISVIGLASPPAQCLMEQMNNINASWRSRNAPMIVSTLALPGVFSLGRSQRHQVPQCWLSLDYHGYV